MTISYSLAETKHGTEVIAQLPRLAAFDHPSRLRAEDFWRDDAKIVRRWQSGAEPGYFIILARDRNGALAESFGCAAYRAETPEQLAKTLPEAFKQSVPTVIEVPFPPTPDPWSVIIPPRNRGL